jgi:hypothetical protein
MRLNTEEKTNKQQTTNMCMKANKCLIIETSERLSLDIRERKNNQQIYLVKITARTHTQINPIK